MSHNESTVFTINQDRERITRALREAELEEKQHPEVISAEESKRRLDEIFSALGMD